VALSKEIRDMQITSPHSGHTFEWQADLAVAFAEELTPLTIEMPADERIAALALQISAAAWGGSDGMGHHECLDGVKAELMGRLVEKFCREGFKAQRKLEAELVSGFGGEGMNEVCDAE
jgi:hypothetical protein